MSEAFEEQKLIETLYKKHATFLKEKANSIINDNYISEDIVQECMLNAFKQTAFLRKLDDNRQLTYLVSTVEHLCEKHLAKRNNKLDLIEFEEVFFSRYFTPEESPEAEVEERINFEILLRTLNKMNRNDQKAIELKYFLMLSDHDMAPLLGIKENSVRMTVRRSVFRLKKQLGIMHNYESIH